MHTVSFRLAAPPGRTIELAYAEVPCPNSQARLVGRTMLKPTIDLSAYSCRAVIDWVVIDVHLRRRTQFQWLQQELIEVVGRTPFVKTHGDNKHATTDLFSITIQEPTDRMLEAALSRLSDRWGLAREVTVSAIEVSVDFYSKDRSEGSLRELEALLSLHLLPGRDVSKLFERPHRNWGPLQSDRAFMFKKSKDPGFMRDILYSHEFEARMPLEGTFYVGAKWSDTFWRIMHKTTDCRTPGGAHELLPVEKHRARIEVSLKGKGVTDLGIRTISDLLEFRFPMLQRRHFFFVLPTFAGHPTPTNSAIVRTIEGWRRQRFLHRGVVGLQIKDRLREDSRRAAHQVLNRQRREAGQTSRRFPKTGTGTHGTFVSYGELNSKVETALRRLSERQS